MRLTICSKMTICFGVVFLILCICSLTAFQGMGTLGGLLNKAFTEDAAAADLLGDIQSDLLKMRAESTSMQFAYVVSHVLKTEASKNSGADSLGDCSVCHQFGGADERRQSFTVLADKAARDTQALKALVHNPSAAKKLEVIEGGIRDWRGIFEQYLQLAGRNDFGNAHGLVTSDMQAVLERVTAAADEFDKEQVAGMALSRSSAAKTTARARWTMAGLVGLGLGCGIFVFAVMQRISGGLRRMIADLNQRSQGLAGDAQAVRSAGHSLAHGASEQAAAIEQTSASSEEVNATARQHAEASQKMTEAMSGIRSHVSETNSALHQTAAAMEEIDRSSESISRIIKVIREIAFQTNLLALNAAVEAARAGEAGMGFAVVADEVRTLAQRCAQAAEDTEELIGASVTRAREGKTRLGKLTAGMHAITQQTDMVNALAEEMQSGSIQQAQAMQEIGNALTRMEQVTQKAAASAEETAAAGESLNAESASLRDVVEHLNGLVSTTR
jgi:methyl-accepting chemotaxis protein